MRRTLSLSQQPSPTSGASMRHNPIVGRYPLPLHILMIEDSKSCDCWGLLHEHSMDIYQKTI